MKGNDMLKKFIHFFILSCKKTTFLIEKKLHTSLSPLENQLYVYRTYSFYRCINESGAVAFPGVIAKYATASLSETLSPYMRG